MGKIGKNKSNIGIIGENIAVKYIISKGGVILKRNFKTFHGELDIVFEKDRRLFFAEVKTVNQNKHLIDPRTNFNPQKYRKMNMAIEYYLLKYNIKSDFETVLLCVYVDQINKKASIRVVSNPIY